MKNIFLTKSGDVIRCGCIIFLPSNVISIFITVNSMPFFVKHCRN